MKKLIIITSKFPYYLTESFLESEYPYLIDKFDKVTFVPIKKGVVRKNYENSSICDSYNELYRKKYLFLFKVLFSLHLYASLFHNIKQVLSKKFIRNTLEQEVHYKILKLVISRNKDLFDSDSIVYSYWFDKYVYSLLKIREEFNYDFKVVTRAHRFDVYDENGVMPNREYCLKTIDRIYPISQDVIRYFSEKYGYEWKFELSRLGVKNNNVISKISDKPYFCVLSVSQVIERKRIKEIYEAVSTFAENHSELEVTWVHFGDGPLLNKLREWSEKNNVSNLQMNIMGRVPNIEVLQYLSDLPVDVFINISSSEGVPVSVMEAQSYGIPVIATNVGGTAEIVNESNGVLLSSCPTNEEVVEALDQILTNSYDRVLIKNNWNLISNAEVNFEKFAEKLKEL